MFCLGVIVHLMMTGENPLEGKNKESKYDRNAPVEWNGKKIEERWGQNGLELISGLLRDNPTQRWDASKVLNCSFLNSSTV